MATILFLHNSPNVPGDAESTYLKDHGHVVFNPALDDDFAAAMETAQLEFDQYQPQVVVGWSRGGAVAMNINIGDAKLVLLSPSWRKWGTATTVNPGTVILHSRADDVVPFSDSKELARNSGAKLIELGSKYRLADPETLSVILWACELVQSGQDIPAFEEDSGSMAETSQKEVSYVCDSCGEEIVIPVDVSEGQQQDYVEDCPVCCHPNTIHVQFNAEGEPTVWAAPEQDYE